MKRNKNNYKTRHHIPDQRLQKAGLPPGTLTAPHEKQDAAVQITIISYNETEYATFTSTDINEILSRVTPGLVHWINVNGIHDIELVSRIGAHFNIHALTLEDIVNLDQRPKFEDYDDYEVAIMKMFMYDKCISSEQLVIVLFENCVISFQEVKGGDVFDPIRERIKSAKGRIRRFGADYLAYALIDTIVDSYFLILDHIGDHITSIDESLTTDPKEQTLKELHALKREMIFLRKSIWPLRELINNMQRSENTLIKESTGIYLRDVYDHTIRVIETVDTYRDMVAGMMDIYHSILSNKMNEIMKVLTIISTIFIPVTFIAGVYGMNFEFMPELHSKYGYIGVWILMISIMISLVIYFRKKKWL